METADVAWCAGFYDGEGCSCAYLPVKSNGKTCRLTLQVSQSGGTEELERLQSTLGCGNIYGPYQHKNRGDKPQYKWQVQRFEDVQWCIIQMWPYLCSVKKDQYRRNLAKWQAERSDAL